MAVFSTATKTEVVNGTVEQIEDLIHDLKDADRTDLIEPLAAIGITFEIDPADDELVLCSCRRKVPTS